MAKGKGSRYFLSSSESGTGTEWAQVFITDGETETPGDQVEESKANENCIRPIRNFTSEDTYEIGDEGPAGGLIFYKSGETAPYYYLECAPWYLLDDDVNIWSNVTTRLAGTSTGIGTGEENTTLIMEQVGHTSSAAKVCYDLGEVTTKTIEVTTADGLETILGTSSNTDGGSWNRLIVTFVTPEHCSSIQLALYPNKDSVTGAIAYWDGLQIETGTEATTFAGSAEAGILATFNGQDFSSDTFLIKYLELGRVTKGDMRDIYDI